MSKIQREALGTNVKYEVWEENFFLGVGSSYSEAEKIQEDFNLCKQEFLRNYQEGKIPIEYGLKDDTK